MLTISHSFEKTNDKITAFKPGHRMVIGNPALRTPPTTGGGSILDNSGGTISPIQFTCPRSDASEAKGPLYPTNSDGLHGVGIGDPNNAGAGVGFPQYTCDGYASPLRADIHFPSCYNPAVGLTDYKNNMAFPTNGDCPAGWVHTPHLFYEVYWNTPKFAGRWTEGKGKQPFVLANGDPTGYGLHGDFISGWDEKTLQQMIDNCDAGDSGMDKCPGLIGGVNDPSDSCNINPASNEQVSGVMKALPGNNPLGVWGGATAADMSGNSTDSAIAAATSDLAAATSDLGSAVTSILDGVKAVATSAPVTLATSYQTATTSIYTTVSAPTSAPTSTDSTNSTSPPLPDSWAWYGCYTDSGSGRAMSGIKFANVGAVTNTNCAAYCDAKGFSMAGTEYGGQCFCDNSISSAIAVNASCDTPCNGDASQICGGNYALSVYAKAGGSGKRSERTKHRHRMVHGVSV